jgi:hypothetical protein
MYRLNIRVATVVATLLVGFAPAVARAQDAEITQAVLDMFFGARKAESAEEDKVDDQVKEVDEKIKKFNECKKNYEVVGSAGRMAQMAAKMAIKSKCGATDDDAFQKEKAKLMEGPEKAAVTAGGYKSVKEYRRLKDRLGLYVAGNTDAFNDNEKKILASRRADLGRILGISVAQTSGFGVAAGSSDSDPRNGRTYNGHAARGIRGGAWTSDVAWEYIGEMFNTMYLSGAMMFEKPYTDGQWTRWELTESDNPDEKTVIERALIMKKDDGSEWWRTKTISMYKEDGKPKADTVTLESQFRNTDQYLRTLVRVRAKMPGKTEPEELLVPENYSTWNLLAFPYKPTPESVEGATVGVEKVAGVDAKHVKFGGSGGGNMEWWLSDALPGGMARFRQTDGNTTGADGKPLVMQMELVGKGTGAKSELGVK